jgi:hypothetical protein
MTHIIYLVMMMSAHGVPQQMAAEATLEKCQADIQQSATVGLGFIKPGGVWYCQPAVAPVSQGPRQ